MAGVLNNFGEDRMLGLLVNKGAGYAVANVTLKLFKNNVVPAETDTSSTFTEATFTGYAPLLLTGSSWSLTPGAPSAATVAQQTFTCTAATSEPIYGYFLTAATSAGSPPIAAEAFSDGPYTVTNNGDSIKITPNISQD